MQKKGGIIMTSETLFAQLPKGPIPEIIVERIRTALAQGELKPGDKIPTEAEFSEKLNVSRNAVREAMKILVSFGVLEIRRAEGTYVVDEYTPRLLDPLVYGLLLSQRSMEELLEFKLGIAMSMLYPAIRNASGEEVRKLRTLAEQFKAVMNETPADIDKCYAASVDYNEWLGRITHNRMQEYMGDMMCKAAAFTRRKAIEVSLERGLANALPDNYLKEVRILENRDHAAVIGFMDERLRLWQELLL